MPYIYLSPSTQEFNPYVNGGNEEFYNYVDDRLVGTNFLSTENYEEKINLLFESVYPVQTCFMDNWERLSYYGGLCTPHYENCKK